MEPDEGWRQMGSSNAQDRPGISANGGQTQAGPTQADQTHAGKDRSADSDDVAQGSATLKKDEIVVASAHSDAVLRALAGHGAVTAVDRRLGLSRVLIDNGPEAAGIFADELARTVVLLGDVSVQPSTSSDHVGQILTGLRARFAREHSGWYPVMGRNRVLVSPETGYMVIRTRENVDPTPAARPPFDRRDGGRGLTIGVLDTPVVEQDDFSWQLKPSSTRVSALPPWPAPLGHSTFLAGLLAQYAPESSIKVRGVLTGEDGSADAWDVAVGLLDLVESGADIVTLALGCLTTDNRPPLVLQTAVSMVRDRALLVAASGNYGPTDAVTSTNGKQEASITGAAAATPPTWPAALDGVVAVGARNPQGEQADFTPDAPWVRLLAPGVDVDSTYLCGDVLVNSGKKKITFDGYARWTGSSLSAAVAAGRLSAAAGQYLEGGSRQPVNDRRRAVRRALLDALQGRDDILVPTVPVPDPSERQRP
jgi:hypothetical protein